eukprot:TRINITY_DN1454_c0_g2_i2.p1 TRINITY_DN1454_c0_g2~~TRINITY_DN1454_c0_g2_i2.p1  ORF type:complete len:617 (+),score=189.44 TRINITY_DN1454_c0_g2_i2:58-1908(+)
MPVSTNTPLHGRAHQPRPRQNSGTDLPPLPGAGGVMTKPKTPKKAKNNPADAAASAVQADLKLLHRAGGLAESELSRTELVVPKTPPCVPRLRTEGRRRPPPLRPSVVGRVRGGYQSAAEGLRALRGRRRQEPARNSEHTEAEKAALALVASSPPVRKGDSVKDNGGGFNGPQGRLPDEDENWPTELTAHYTLDRTWKQRVGGFGAVQRALDRSDRSPVAVKRIFPRNFEKLTRAVKVLREARVLEHLSRCAEGHVVPFRELVIPARGDEAWFVMDFVDSDLQRLLPPRTEGIGSLAQACYIMKRLLLALRAAHACGVVHRDLKPQNVLVNTQLDNNVVMLCDFGFARALAEDGMMTQFGTSHAYWAPEMIMQDSGYTRHVFAHGVHAHYDARVDLWAAGAIFGELLGWGGPMFQPQGRVGDFWDYGYEHETLAGQLGHVDCLNAIVQVMGTPSDDDMEAIKASESMRRWVGTLPPGSETGTFEDTCSKLKLMRHAGIPGAQALDLLRKLLQYDWRKRPTAEEALAHPLFTECFAEWEEDDETPDLSHPVRFVDDSASIDSIPEVMRQLRLLSEQMDRRRPQGSAGGVSSVASSCGGSSADSSPCDDLCGDARMLG